MRVGLSKVDITPPIGIWMSGYGARERAEVINDPLYAQALVIEGDGGNRAVILAGDVLGFDEPFVAEVRAELQARYGIEPDAVLLNGSHNHGGPAILSNFVTEAPHMDLEYRRRLFDSLVVTTGDALAQLAPAEAHHGWGRCRVGINRRGPRPPYPSMPNPEGFYDDTVGVLAFLKPGGDELLAAVFNHGCHPTTLGGVPVICADWPGFARDAVDEWLGAPRAMFLQGAGGNIRPLTCDFGATRWRAGTVAEAARIGHACAHEVVNVLYSGLKPAGGALQARRIAFELPLDNPLTPAELERRATEGSRYEQAHAAYLRAKYPDGHLPDSLPYEAQLFTFGEEVSLLALPGEVVSDLGFAARTTVPRPTLFCGYSNGLPAYIPTARIRRLGGYEAGLGSVEYFGLPGWLRQDTELVILDAIERLVAGEA